MVFSGGKKGNNPQQQTFGPNMPPPSMGEDKTNGQGLKASDIEQMFGVSQMGHAAKELISPGHSEDTVLSLTMRTFLRDFNEARLLMLTFSKFDRFGMDMEKKSFLYLLAANRSVQGRSTDDFLQALAQVIVPSLRGAASRIKEEAKQ